MALHLSATTGESVSAAQLLGEEDVTNAARLEEAEKEAAAFDKRLGKAMPTIAVTTNVVNSEADLKGKQR